MRKLYIPIFSNSIQAKKFSISLGNPGVGGTEFTSIILALTLASAQLNWKIVLVHSQEIILEDPPPTLSQEIFSDISAFLSSLQDSQFNIVIVPALILIRVQTALLKKFEHQIICWSHHPFDVETQILNSKIDFRGIVCVGTYQFYSNTNLKSKIYHIQNIFPLPDLTISRDSRILDKRQINIVFLGALTLGKGFSEIAKSWQELKRRFPGVKLHVIGSSETYGWRVENNLVPTSKQYARKILRYIPVEDIHQGHVVFYGNLGVEKWDIITQCDLAILNPTGKTEAFPASILECMACGTPVIASDDYGMSDVMRFFPELTINGHKNILEKVEWLVSDLLRYREMQQRSKVVAQWFSSQRDTILARWTKLLEVVSSTESNSNETEELELLPTLSFCNSRITLFLRQLCQGYFILKMRFNMSMLGGAVDFYKSHNE